MASRALAKSVRRSIARTCSSTRTPRLLQELQKLDTACLCDAEKQVLQKGVKEDTIYQPLSLLNGLEPLGYGDTIAGVARTVQLKQANDILGVLEALLSAEKNDVLVVNTLDSTKAVAGELFFTEAQRRGLQGILVDGPMRDTPYIRNNYHDARMRCFCRSVTPSAGTASHLGDHQIAVQCGGSTVEPDDIVVADDDGIIAASVETFETLLPVATKIKTAEERIRLAIESGKSLRELTNFEDHLAAIREKKPSSLQFTK